MIPCSAGNSQMGHLARLQSLPICYTQTCLYLLKLAERTDHLERSQMIAILPMNRISLAWTVKLQQRLPTGCHNGEQGIMKGILLNPN